MIELPPQPTLTDGVVTLRAWRDDDVDPARFGHDEEIARWFGSSEVLPSHETLVAAVRRWRAGYADHRSTVNFLVEHERRPAGAVEVRRKDDDVGELSWALYGGMRGRGLAMRAVRLLVRYAFDELGLDRVEAYVDPANTASLRVASRAGLRREGVLRMRGVTGRRRTDSVLLARLVDDPDPVSPGGFRAVLNAGLPRKRAIGQLLVRDPDARVLLCRLTYKDDWDLPGGVSEVGESPAATASREVAEELSLTIRSAGLLVVDWLPVWAGWDDALCFVYDGGVHHADLTTRARLEPREIRAVEFCAPDQVRDRCRDFTARRVEAALRALEAGTTYLESGAESPLVDPHRR